MSNDDSATLKNCSSDSTLNADVSRAPVCRRSDATQRVRRLGLTTFNPFGCREYSTGAELRHALRSITSADSSTARSIQLPAPPRRTTSLGVNVPSLRQSSVSPPSVVDKTSEIQKLASLARKLATSRRVPALVRRAPPPPRFDPQLIPNALTVTTPPSSELRTSHRLDLPASCLSCQTVVENEEDDIFVTETSRSCTLPSPALCDDDESALPASLLLLRRPDSNDANSVSSRNNNSTYVTVAVNCITSSIGTAEVNQFLAAKTEVCSTHNDDDIAADNGVDSASDLNACAERDISQATALMASPVQDRVIATTSPDCGDGPLPVSARLIITSPVSSRACVVQNPHRRSMCKPLTTTLSRVDNVDLTSDMVHPITSSLRRYCSPERPAVVESCGDAVNQSNCGRSWYDVIHADSSFNNSGTEISEAQDYTAARCIASLSLDGDFSLSDMRSISSESSLVSDKSSEISGNLQPLTSRRVAESSALNETNSPSPLLQHSRPRRRTASTTAYHSIITDTTSLSATVTAADHLTSASFTGVTVDSVATKGINLKRLKKARHACTTRPQSNKGTCVNLADDIQRRLSGHRTMKTAYSELAAAVDLTNDWRRSPENETESRPVFTSFISNSLGRHEFRTYNKLT